MPIKLEITILVILLFLYFHISYKAKRYKKTLLKEKYPLLVIFYVLHSHYLYNFIYISNESASQKTLNITGFDTYVIENYSLSREKITAFTQVSSDSCVVVKAEFVFTGKGTRTKLNPLEGIKYHWAPKGSYRLEQI